MRIKCTEVMPVHSSLGREGRKGGGLEDQEGTKAVWCGDQGKGTTCREEAIWERDAQAQVTRNSCDPGNGVGQLRGTGQGH